MEKNNRCKGDNEKAYIIIRNHLTPINDNMKWLRNRMDSDQQLKLNDSKDQLVVKK